MTTIVHGPHKIDEKILKYFFLLLFECRLSHNQLLSVSSKQMKTKKDEDKRRIKTTTPAFHTHT